MRSAAILLDAMASLVLAGAVVFAASALGGGFVAGCGAALGAGGAAFALLRRVNPPQACSTAFELRALAFADDCEAEGELLLDDVLAQIEPDSRVIHLFERQSLPTAGEMVASIDRHLRDPRAMAAPLDASQALHDALAELRRSLG